MSEDRLFPVAAGVAFYGLLSLVPSLAAAVSLFGLFADPARLAKLPDVLTTVLPGEAVSLVQGEAQAPRLARGVIFVASSSPSPSSFRCGAPAPRCARCSTRSMSSTSQEEQRSLVRLYGTALAVTLGGIVVLSLAVVLIGASPAFLHGLPHEAVSSMACCAGRCSSASPCSS